MEKQTRHVDVRGRMTLFREFAGTTVTIERVSAIEVRVRKVGARKRKYALRELVAKITPKNRHPEIDTGLPVGREAW